MRRAFLLRVVPFGAPLASPLASSHGRGLPWWRGAFARITPGALTVCGWVLLVWLGGWS